jgi:hypothetical protein
MVRGARKGNKNAVKSPEEKREGVTISLYLDAYTLEFLQAACQLAGEEPTQANARKRAKRIALEAIRQDARRTFAHPDLPRLLNLPP